jgi:SAM-dependent methyltransferase
MIADRGGRAAHYRHARPPYSPHVASFVTRHVGRLATAVDIGCGTGLSTRALRRVSNTLVGVEPDDAMRAAATESLAALGVPVRSGSAEATSLAARSVDLIVAALCFEWFDRQRAADEFRRILRPPGWVLLMWNHRVVADEVTRAWAKLWLDHMGPRLGPAPADIEEQLVPTFLAMPAQRLRRSERHSYDRARLRRFAFSSGYAPRPGQPRRRSALLKATNDFWDSHAVAGRVSLAFETVAILGTLRGAGAGVDLGPEPVDQVASTAQAMTRPSPVSLRKNGHG